MQKSTEINTKAKKFISKIALKLPHRNSQSQTIVNLFEAVISNLEQGELKSEIEKNLESLYDIFESTIVGKEEVDNIIVDGVHAKRPRHAKTSSDFLVIDTSKVEWLLGSSCPAYSGTSSHIHSINHFLATVKYSREIDMNHASTLMKISSASDFTLFFTTPEALNLATNIFTKIGFDSKYWTIDARSTSCLIAYATIVILLNGASASTDIIKKLQLLYIDCEDNLHVIFAFVGYWGMIAATHGVLLTDATIQDLAIIIDLFHHLSSRSMKYSSEISASKRKYYITASLFMFCIVKSSTSNVASTLYKKLLSSSIEFAQQFLSRREDNAMEILLSFVDELDGVSALTLEGDLSSSIKSYRGFRKAFNYCYESPVMMAAFLEMLKTDDSRVPGTAPVTRTVAVGKGKGAASHVTQEAVKEEMEVAGVADDEGEDEEVDSFTFVIDHKGDSSVLASLVDEEIMLKV